MQVCLSLILYFGLPSLYLPLLPGWGFHVPSTGWGSPAVPIHSREALFVIKLCYPAGCLLRVSRNSPGHFPETWIVMVIRAPAPYPDPDGLAVSDRYGTVQDVDVVGLASKLFVEAPVVDVLHIQQQDVRAPSAPRFG